MSRALRRLGRRARGVTAAAIAVLGCGAPEDLPPPPQSRVVRLGRGDEFAVRGPVSRRLLGAGVAEAELDAAGLPAGRLWLAVGHADPEAPASARCRAELRRADGTARRLARLELSPTRPGWQSAAVDIDPGRAGRLVLRCDGPAIWAQPVAVPRPAESAVALVVLSIDTLRADRVRGFGGRPDPMPELGRLGDEGLRLVNATSDGTWTTPSHGALFFSNLVRRETLIPVLRSIAVVLADAGFLTVGVTGGGFLGAELGFARGFDHYRVREDDGPLERLPDMLDEAEAWLERSDGAPVFLFLHTYAVHVLSPDQKRWHAREGRRMPFRPTPAQAMRTVAWYDELVARVDAELAGFFEALRELRRRRPVLLVVVSDHGEAFFEHGFWGHGTVSKPYDELIRIPAIVWGSGIEPGRSVDHPAMLADVAPTLLGAVGVAPPPSMRGSNLWPLWSGAELRGATPEGSVVQNQRWSALRTPSRKLIVRRDGDVDPERATGAELYALDSDPEERRNLAAERPGEVRRLLGVLRDRLRALGVRKPNLPGFAPPADRGDGDLPGRDGLRADLPDRVDDLTREQLRELGYLE